MNFLGCAQPWTWRDDLWVVRVWSAFAAANQTRTEQRPSLQPSQLHDTLREFLRPLSQVITTHLHTTLWRHLGPGALELNLDAKLTSRH